MKLTFLSNALFQKLAIVVLPVLAYLGTVQNEYALDDALYITDNSFTKKGVAGISDHLTEEALVGFYGEQKQLLSGGRYRPLAPVTYALEYELYGFKPGVSHFLNIVLYGLMMWLIYHVMLLFFSGRKTLPVWLFGALLLYAVHPLHAEVVANIKGRDQILSMIFVALTLQFIVQGLKGKTSFWALAGASFFLGLMSKESTVTFLPLLPLALYFFFPKKLTAKNYLITGGSLLVPTLVWFIVRQQVVGEVVAGVETNILNDPYIESTAGEKYGTIFYTFLLYLKLHVFPYPLTHDYYPFHIPIKSLTDPLVVISLVLILIAIGLAAWGLAKKKAIAFWIIFFGATFSISSNLVLNIGTIMNERFMFEASMAVCVGLAFAIHKLIPKGAVGGVLYIGVSVIFGILTFNRSLVWKDNFTLFTTDVEVSQNSAKCLVSAGGMYYEKAQNTQNRQEKKALLTKSVPLLERAIELLPGNNNARLLLGNAADEQHGLNDTTTGQYLAVLRQTPDFEPVHKNIIFMLKNNRYPAKNRVRFGQRFEKELIDDLAFHYQMGKVYCQELNQLDVGANHFKRCLDINPNFPGALKDLGTVYGMQGKFQESNIYFLRAHEIDQSDPQVLQGLILNYQNLGQPVEADKFKQKLEGRKG